MAKPVAIKTEFVYPPIPIRTMDWQAVVDGWEPGLPMAHGATEEEAIQNLKDEIADSDDELFVVGEDGNVYYREAT